MTSVVVLSDTSKSYGATPAVRHVSFELESGEFFVLLGPSGSGKSTILRMIAGFEHPSTGSILVRGRPVAGFPPHKRDIGVVFQHLALFPHLSVFKNVAFGLEMRRLNPSLIRDKVSRMLDLVQLSGLEERLPKQLSGGQQQRVALARALVIEPDVLLLDEPLGSLDRHLRVEMQGEIRRLQRTLGIATIMVTHDQEEAITLGDRIGILRDGSMEQIGTPADVYGNPSSVFIAKFMGAANLFQQAVVERGGLNATCRTVNDLTIQTRDGSERVAGQVVDLVVRPETIRVSMSPEVAENCYEAEVQEIEFTGASTKCTLSIGGSTLTSVRQNDDDAKQAGLEPGARVFASWPATAVRIIKEP